MCITIGLIRVVATGKMLVRTPEPESVYTLLDVNKKIICSIPVSVVNDSLVPICQANTTKQNSDKHSNTQVRYVMQRTLIRVT